MQLHDACLWTDSCKFDDFVIITDSSLLAQRAGIVQKWWILSWYQEQGRVIFPRYETSLQPHGKCCIQLYFPRFKKYLAGSETTEKGNNKKNEGVALQKEPKKAEIFWKSGEGRSKEGYDWGYEVVKGLAVVTAEWPPSATVLQLRDTCPK